MTALTLPRGLEKSAARGDFNYTIDAVAFVIHRPLFSIIACNFHSLSKSTGRDLIFSREERG